MSLDFWAQASYGLSLVFGDKCPTNRLYHVVASDLAIHIQWNAVYSATHDKQKSNAKKGGDLTGVQEAGRAGQSDFRVGTLARQR